MQGSKTFVFLPMTLHDSIDAAETDGRLLTSAASNLRTWLGGMVLPEWAAASISELVARNAWGELNDRFFRDLEFGTGGLRSRTIGRILTAAERGAAIAGTTPAHASVGSYLLNDFTLIRATVGLFNYARRFLGESSGGKSPRLVIAHDVRHFSRHFCELAASTWCRLGG